MMDSDAAHVLSSKERRMDLGLVLTTQIACNRYDG